MTPTKKKLIALVLSVAVTAAACGSSDERSGDASTTTAATPAREVGDSSDPVSDTTGLLQSIGDRYTAASGLWPGFEPNDHPTVLAVRDDQRTVLRIIALNHPNPEKLGAVTELDTTGTPFKSAHEIKKATDINPEDLEKLSNMVNFDFHLTLGGVDSFAINANNDLGVKGGDYAATLIHEMFHRWQDSAFTAGLGDQDVDNYAFTKENLELAVLEQRALTAAVDAGDDGARMTAARHYAALRLQRRDADKRLDLDDRQEMFEGSARYLEHASHTTGGSYGPNDYSAELGNEFATSDGIKGWFAFGRFYSSGAAAIHLADQLGADNALDRISAGGEFPADLVIKASGVTSSDVAKLVAEARSTYDPDGSVAKAAAEGQERAKSEGGVFDDIDSSAGAPPSGGPGDSFEEGEGVAVTPEQEECLNEAGIGEDGIISDEVFERCIGG